VFGVRPGSAWETGHPKKKTKNFRIWMKEMEDGSQVIGLFTLKNRLKDFS